ncbi:octopamine receptor beta-3R [Zootermopsis nevadensis]|uniref:G-protein coupled receptors family 1 profile domain-containing protein n=1 Tax=Zootermopsis nevadensis TaxID=136037 RepID=A0A067R1B0_ZOONE|nr:octopamine receptor beta-3R [Zootermopsis nevadensis]XP_021932539.1 octopamine receptor beta-3R [Zootermopsis nevadensis]XP_021932540.1 octopamine receptor beta-3R [Zootermopsis nevadensis]XP_021932541.1 octopamine receptor beta-3R [Zootermopsis nevadensis]XP_021932542.1 octopamine receptor beta-3R [Zootermopsis nevadensis]XP_021932543.1 octopamine receptor beta-3R [Zootermopsis nevadensis]XP_021932544.1 octopamine receptor beta-3R [Zootermopsis nevadensis]XP_021932545.1 octopamine recept
MPCEHFNNISSIDKTLNSHTLWSILDCALLVIILCGNTLTIMAIRCSRRLSNVMSNHFVLSLAISDLVVGLTLPYHIAFYLYEALGQDKERCILRFVLLALGCTASVCNLIIIAVDRYISIVYPLHYCRLITHRVATVMIATGWCTAVALSTMPIYWNNWSANDECEIEHVMAPNYFVYIMLPLFLLLWVAMFVIYWKIWREAMNQARRLQETNYLHGGGPSDWKSSQVVLLVLGSFSVCWLPYMIIACIILSGVCTSDISIGYKAAFSMAMANSCMNPMIYAWKNSEFRQAIKRLLHCRSPNRISVTPSFILANKISLQTIGTYTDGSEQQTTSN